MWTADSSRLRLCSILDSVFRHRRMLDNHYMTFFHPVRNVASAAECSNIVCSQEHFKTSSDALSEMPPMQRLGLPTQS
jgi:hypothetical protein